MYSLLYCLGILPQNCHKVNRIFPTFFSFFRGFDIFPGRCYLIAKGGAKMQIRNMVLCGLMTALLCICSWLCIPVGSIGITLQSFAIALILGLLGGKWGTVTVAVYLLLGAVGAPVFSFFRGGLGALIGATGGFLLGFLAQALLYWLLTALLPDSSRMALAALCLSQLMCYAVGVFWYCTVYSSGLSIGAILMTCVVPYLLPDTLKLLLAHTLTARLRKFLYR